MILQANDIAGKVIVITGAGRGIGRAFAENLAAQGARLVIADRDGALGEATAAAITAAAASVAAGGSALAVQTDIADSASVLALRDAVLAAHGRVDVLVNNAALMSTIERRPFWEITPEEFDRVMQVNTGGTFRVSAALVPVMQAQGWGRIINMSSSTVLVGHPNYLHYVGSKAALQGMTRSMARELSGSGVTVNVLLPGQILTGDDANIGQTEAAVAKVRERQFVKRSGQTEDLTGLLTWLISASSDFTTGQSFVVDGGFALM